MSPAGVLSHMAIDILLLACAVMAMGLLLALRLERRGVQRRTRAALGVAQSLVTAEDPRMGFCDAVRRITGADRALIVELAERQVEFVVTAVSGPPLDAAALELGETRAAAPSAFRTGESIFVRDARRDDRVSSALVAGGVRSLLAQPFRRGELAVGVVVVTWSRRTRLSSDVASVVELLSASAALAIERSRLLTQAEQAARTDALTGVANRRVWDRALPRELARAARSGCPVSIALVDLDRFKAFNDTQGHQAGDELLREAARRWSAELRATDLLARYGGEEFAVMLPGSATADALEAVERLRALTPRGQTVSAGLATWDGAEAAESLLARADRALYRAKAEGRDRVEIDDRDAHHRLGDRLEPLRRADD